MALSFALVLLPNYQSFLGASESSLKSAEAGGRQTRNLLSKPDDFINPVPQQEKTSFNYVPFLNFDKMVTPKSRQPIDEPVDGMVEKSYVHDPLDGVDEGLGSEIGSPVLFGEGEEKVIHMEITQIPDGPVNNNVEGKKVNYTAESDYIPADQIVGRRKIRMDLDDEL